MENFTTAIYALLSIVKKNFGMRKMKIVFAYFNNANWLALLLINYRVYLMIAKFL